MAGLGTLALSFGAGALSTLSPCVLPLLPIILLGALERHKWAPVALAAGLSISFASLGLAISSLAFAAGYDPAALRLSAALLMLAVGVFLLVPAIQDRVASFASPLSNTANSLLQKVEPSGVAGQFLVGVLLGAVWSPCSGPTLGAAIGMAAQGETLGTAASIMFVFAIGAATPIIALAYGSRQAILSRRDWFARWSLRAKPLMGSAFVILAAGVLTGFDKVAESSLTSAMPDWLVAITTRL